MDNNEILDSGVHPVQDNDLHAPPTGGAGVVPYSRHDLTPRPRGSQDTPGSFTYAAVLVDPVPLDETPLAPTLAVIEERRPDLAHALRHLYDCRLVPAVLEIDNVRAEEEHCRPERIRQAEEHNVHVDRMQAEIRADRDEAVQPCWRWIGVVKRSLAEAHKAAGEAFSAADGRHDPRVPSEKGLPLPRPRSEASIAAEHNLPWPLRENVFQLPPWLHGVFTALVGLLLGVNLGLATHGLEVDTLPRHPVEVLLAWAVGSALAEIAWRALKGAYYNLAAYYYLGPPRARFWASLAVALLLTILLLGADVATLRLGLLALARVRGGVLHLSGRGHAAPGESDAAGVLWLVSLVVTLGFVAYAALQGIAEGRHDPVANLIRRHQEADLRDREAAFGRRPRVQAARRALTNVEHAQRQHEEAEAQLAAAAAPFEERLAAWERQRLPGRVAIEERSRQRVQDAIHNAVGLQQEFDQALRAALETCHQPASGRNARH